MNQISPFAFSTSPNFDSLVVTGPISSGTSPSPVHLAADPVAALDAVTKQYVDGIATRAIPPVGLTPPASPTPGQFWFSSGDAQLYIWYDDGNSAQWVIVTSGGLQDAPASSVAYGRQNGNWAPVLPLTGGVLSGMLTLAADPVNPLDAVTKSYLDGSLMGYLPLTGGTVSGPIYLAGDPLATRSYVDDFGGLVTVSDIPPASPKQGQLWFDSASVQTYIWFIDGAGDWVPVSTDVKEPDGEEGSGPGTEAPMDGLAYGRESGDWAPVVPLAGGTMTGPLILSGDPTDQMQAVTKEYLEVAVANSMNWQGSYIVATNVPALNSYVPVNGYSWTAVTTSPGTPDAMTISLPGIPAGTLIHNGDLIRFSNLQWFLIPAATLTTSQANLTYLQKVGGTMTGALYLANLVPYQPNEAASKQYVDMQKPVVASLAPGAPHQGQFWYDLANHVLKMWVVTGSSSSWVTI